MTKSADKKSLHDVYARYGASLSCVAGFYTRCTLMLPIPTARAAWAIATDKPFYLGPYKIKAPEQTRIALTEMMQQLQAAYAMAVSDPEGMLDNLKSKSAEIKTDLAILYPTLHAVNDSTGNKIKFKPYVTSLEEKITIYTEIDYAIQALEPPPPSKPKRLTW